MTWPLVQLTNGPAIGADVLYAFNVDNGLFVDGDDPIDFGVPEWSGDPDAVGGVYGYRTVSFTQLVDGGRPTVLAELATLSRLLLAAEAWLMVQMSPTSVPRWYHTWRSTPAALDPSNVILHNDNPQGLWGIAMSVKADPWLYGERVTQPTVTVANNPTAATNPMSVVLPEIVGDAPAPLRIGVTPSGDTMSRQWLLGVTRALKLHDVGTGDGLTTGAGTSAPVSDSSYAGGSYRATSFTTTPGMADRLTCPDMLPSGEWLILVRVAASGPSPGSAVFRIAVRGLIHTNPVMTTVTLPALTDQWVVVGRIRGGADVPADVDSTPADEYMILAAERVSGAYDLRWDAIALVAVGTQDEPDSATLLFDTPIYPTGADFWWDGDQESYWAEGTTTTYAVASRQQRGVYPTVSPGATNTFVLVPAIADPLQNVPDDITDSSAVTLSYLPRYVWPAP